MNTDQDCFDCTVEDEISLHDFGMDSDIEGLIEMLDILRDAKHYNWVGFDKIYRDNW